MDRIRVGFIGLGGICRARHVPGLRRIPGVEIVAVANRTLESSRRAAEEFGIPHVCGSWRELIARDDIDAVFIGAWPCAHRDISVAALDAGKHVFCQARMAMNYAEALEMRDAARASGRVAMLCPVPIGLSVDKTVARLLNESFLGEVRLVRAQSFTDAYASPAAPMNWRKDHRLSGLNMWTLGMYIEVIHRWFGWTRAVMASTQIFVPERVDESGARVRVEIPDQILFHAEMEAGFPVQYTISAVVPHGWDRIEVYGNEGALWYDTATDTLEGAHRNEEIKPIEIREEDRYDTAHWRVEQDFIDAIRLGAAYRPTFDEGLRYMQVIQGVYDSARAGTRVELKNP